MTREFVHRASARDVNAKHLPPKTEYVVFVRPSPVQAALYRAMLRRGARDGSQPLRALQQLQRLCNSASLLMRRDGLISRQRNTSAVSSRASARRRARSRGAVARPS